MKKLLIIFILCLCTYSANSQSVYEIQRRQDSLNIFQHHVGGFFNYNLNIHTVDGFRQITDRPFCSNDLEAESGSGFSFGVLYNWPMTRKISIQGRLGYYMLDGVFTSETPTTISGGIEATEKYNLTAYLGTVGVDLFGTYEIFDDFRFQGGIFFVLPMSMTFDQYEEIVDKDGVAQKFEDGFERHHVEDGTEITNASPFLFSLTGGVSYDLPMGSKFKISPEVLLSYGLTQVTSDAEFDWSILSFRLGAAIKYEFDRPCPPGMIRIDGGDCEWIPCPPNMVHDLEGFCICRDGMFLNDNGVCEWPPCDKRNYARDTGGVCIQYLYSEADVEFIDFDGIPSEPQLVTLKQYPTVISQPLLNYIFFEEGKSNIPKRYNRYDSEDVGFFREKQIIDPKNPINTYYHILDIIGYRLSTNPFASITLRAYNTKGSESNQKDLPQDRIDSVANYLKNIWKIQDNRLHTRVFNLPPEMHNTSDHLLLAETRRVEFIPDSSNMEIIYPLIVEDRTYKSLPPITSYKLDVLPMTKIVDWNLTATHDGKAILDTSGKTNPPESIEFDLNYIANELNPENNSIEYKLWVKDSDGDEKRSENTFQINWMSYDENREPTAGDSSFAFFSFLFNEKDIATDIRKNASLIDSIVFNKFKSFLRIKGYTGIHGDRKQNKILTHDWTLAFAAYMQDKSELADKYFSTEGFGSMELFDNSTAEGRYYNKTVVVEVSTPLEAKKEQDLNFKCCKVVYLTTDNKTIAENVLDYFVQRKVKDIFIEPWVNEYTDETYFRVISKCFDNVRDAVITKAKISHIIRQLKLDKQPVIKCDK